MIYDALKEKRDEVAAKARDNIADICERFGARDAGSEGEKQTAEYFEGRLKAVCDDVKTEKFSVAPDAYFAWASIVASLALLSFVAYFFSALVSILLAVIGVVVYVIQFIASKHFFDPLYKVKTSQNVTAVKNPSGEIRNRLFFVAHIDATKEWTLLYRLGGGAMDFVIISSLIGLVYLVGANIANWVIVGGLGASIASGAMLIVGLVAIAFLPGWICLYFLINPKRVIDGANEDLSGCEVALAVLESMKEQGVEVQNTQIGVILTGSGSVGQRGAQAWCERHKNDYNDVPTTFVCLDTLRETEALRVNTKELNGFVKNDASVVNLISKSAKSLTKGALTLGATDSAEFSRQGFKSASITGYSQRCPQYLHTRYDSFDNVNDKCIAKAYEACVRIVDAVDNK